MLTNTPIMQELVTKLENDVRNGLHSVLAMLELIGSGPLNEAQFEQWLACRASADQLLRAVHNVSEFVTSEWPGESSDFDLRRVLTQVVEVMRPVAAGKGLELVYDNGLKSACHVTSDPNRIETILLRLLDNAIQFSEQGYVGLTVIATEEPNQIVSVHFEVSDTGPGFSIEALRRALSPPAEDFAWHGLGLAIVRNLVKSLGGELSINSRPGGGSCVGVSLSLPLAKEVAPELTRSSAGKASVKRGDLPLNILVVEDCDDSYYVLENYLREAHHQLTRASDGETGIAVFMTGHFDLVFMDVHMPGIDGYTATRAMRDWETQTQRARVPIVILSSDSPATQMHKGAKVGCSGYLTKPVSKTSVLNVVRQYAMSASEYWLP